MDCQTDDLKWFGEGFEGFPKRLSENSVEYSLFIIDAKLKPRELLSRLELVRREASELTKKLLKDYIWQREEFKLKSKVQTETGLRYLHGITDYGDSIEDEWLIVYLLRELSRRFSDLWVKVVDTDGEFLLIEAANTLPKWLNPEITDNRVWINDNRLRIIPLVASQASSTHPETNPESKQLIFSEAHRVISMTPELLIHLPLVEAEAFYRLNSYPQQINNSLHYACVTLPRKLAYILHNSPTSIAQAVEAFYLRDPVALKALQKESIARILTPDDLVVTSIRFTRVLYAQLKSQHFSPPEIWKSTLTKAEKTATSETKKPSEYAQLEMGMKVTSGFEILLADALYRDRRSVREIQLLLRDLEEGVTLPTDAEIESWPNGRRADDDSWLNINFEDFEKELQGNSGKSKKSEPEGSFGPSLPSGFGDAKTQADLRKLVQRYEEFLGDQNAGYDGAELDMDVDDEGEDEDEDSDEEGKGVSFDEREFKMMIREMMGLSAGESDEIGSPIRESRSNTKEEDAPNGGEEASEEEEIHKVMQEIEAELKEAGALNLDPTPSKFAAAIPSQERKGGEVEKEYMKSQDLNDESDEEINIDLNLAQNLLESFKAQAGMAGPGGNLMGMMGMHMPRDEDE